MKMGVMPQTGEVWKNLRGKVLEEIRVYFFEDGVHSESAVGPDFIIKMVNTHWRLSAEKADIPHWQNIPVFKWETSVEDANVRVKFKCTL